MPVCPECGHSFDYGDSAKSDFPWDRKSEKPPKDQTTLTESVGGTSASEGPAVPRLDDLDLTNAPSLADELDDKLDEETPDLGDFINPTDPAKW